MYAFYPPAPATILPRPIRRYSSPNRSTNSTKGIPMWQQAIPAHQFDWLILRSQLATTCQWKPPGSSPSDYLFQLVSLSFRRLEVDAQCLPARHEVKLLPPGSRLRYWYGMGSVFARNTHSFIHRVILGVEIVGVDGQWPTISPELPVAVSNRDSQALRGSMFFQRRSKKPASANIRTS
jgi:hypothetical protein